jgi:hypothetical protein
MTKEDEKLRNAANLPGNRSNRPVFGVHLEDTQKISMKKIQWFRVT